MVAQAEARAAAVRQAERLLLDELAVEVVETDAGWVYTFTPKGRVRGGGFRLTVSKATGQVTGVVRFQ